MLSPRFPHPLFRHFAGLCVIGTSVVWAVGVVVAAPTKAAANFKKEIQPLLAKYCYDCHADGVNKGQVSFDTFSSDADMLSRHDFWLKALKNVRSDVMPPREDDAPRPTAAEIDRLAKWIKYEAFGLDPAQPDPGRVTVRRLNRAEYRNTINDLMGVEFNAEAEFPPDDSGNGFDNIGDVLTISPLHLEKYLQAAETIVDRAVPRVAKLMPERTASGREFRAAGGPATGERLLVTRPAKVSRTFRVDREETYRVTADLEVRGSFDFDPGRGTLICSVDGTEWFREAVQWQERKPLRHEKEFKLTAGSHVVAFQIVPAEQPVGSPAPVREQSVPGATSVTVRVTSVNVSGPLNPAHWTTPANYARFFPHGAAPADAAARDTYARELLTSFTTRAYRRPAAAADVTRLVELARKTSAQTGQSFEDGVARAMMAVLASPKFLFRIEAAVPGTSAVADLDDYALASRLSYFLWSTMPDRELFKLAEKGELRSALRSQIARMLADPKAQALVKNFTGQWLQVRDVDSVPINARAVLGPDARRNRDGRIEFDSGLRRAMRSETEMSFGYVVKEDRSILELLECDYTFLNERLADHYGIPNVVGDEMRLVKLPPGSARGGVLTQGAVLAVTSNPTRTSPVKRGLFLLDNILGTPAPPPPPDVPTLEAVAKEFGGREPKLSEMLAFHRRNPMCSSCHERMDPLGLAFENFNAMGGWRDKDARQPIDVTGHLSTGEKFSSVTDLKRVLTHERHLDFYRCLTEKLMIYALGRGLDYRDIETVDQIVARLEREGGKMSVLLYGVMESVPFQKLRRAQNPLSSVAPSASALAQNSAKVTQ